MVQEKRGEKRGQIKEQYNLYHLVTDFVRCTVLLADMDLGSALAMVRVYMSENRGSLDETTSPVLLKESCFIHNEIKPENISPNNFCTFLFGPFV
jgi:hypothetical protein